MKLRKSKTIITLETFQRTAIRSRKTARIALCERCAAAAPSQAAAPPQPPGETLKLTEASGTGGTPLTEHRPSKQT